MGAGRLWAGPPALMTCLSEGQVSQAQIDGRATEKILPTARTYQRGALGRPKAQRATLWTETSELPSAQQAQP